MTDEYYAQSPGMRSFIERVLAVVAAEPYADARVEQIRPASAALLAEPT